MKNFCSVIRQAGYRSLSPLHKPVKMAYDVFQTKTTDPFIPSFIVLHGLMGSRNRFQDICKHVHSATKRQVFNLDARNHGDSPHVKEHTVQAMAADIAYHMKDYNIRQASIMGHDMGGRAMMFFALRYPSLVEKAIFLDISPLSIPRRYHNVNKFFYRMSKIKIPEKLSQSQAQELIVRKLMESFDNLTTIEFIANGLKKLKNGRFAWAANIEVLRKDFADLLNTQQFQQAPFKGPVLFICGRHSDFFKPHDIVKVRDIFPNAKVEWLHCDHWVHIKQPKKVQELVVNFLNN